MPGFSVAIQTKPQTARPKKYSKTLFLSIQTLYTLSKRLSFVNLQLTQYRHHVVSRTPWSRCGTNPWLYVVLL